jgi:hypothetical protein
MQSKFRKFLVVSLSIGDFDRSRVGSGLPTQPSVSPTVVKRIAIVCGSRIK